MWSRWFEHWTETEQTSEMIQLGSCHSENSRGVQQNGENTSNKRFMKIKDTV